MSRLFVGNIPHAAMDADLKGWVEQRGFAVEVAEIIRDRSTGFSRGFGFVTLREAWRDKEAIGALNGKSMSGRVLTVNEALPHSASLDTRGKRIA
jgi:RNA recognition motif-containing protein